MGSRRLRKPLSKRAKTRGAPCAGSDRTTSSARSRLRIGGRRRAPIEDPASCVGRARLLTRSQARPGCGASTKAVNEPRNSIGADAEEALLRQPELSIPSAEPSRPSAGPGEPTPRARDDGFRHAPFRPAPDSMQVAERGHGGDPEEATPASSIRRSGRSGSGTADGPVPQPERDVARLALGSGKVKVRGTTTRSRTPSSPKSPPGTGAANHRLAPRCRAAGSVAGRRRW